MFAQRKSSGDYQYPKNNWSMSVLVTYAAHGNPHSKSHPNITT